MNINNKCKILSFEGMDTAGKSLQTKKVKELLEAKGHKVHLIHFPRYEKPIGDLIGKILKGKVDSDLNPIAMQMLYVADQIDFQSELDKYKEEECIVLLDRYSMSTKVYALSTTDIDMEEIMNYQVRLAKANLTVILDIPVEEIVKRKAVLDKFERDEALQGRIRTNYMAMSFMNQRPSNTNVHKVVVVDANRDEDEVTEDIMKEIETRWVI